MFVELSVAPQRGAMFVVINRCSVSIAHCTPLGAPSVWLVFYKHSTTTWLSDRLTNVFSDPLIQRPQDC